jgi:hypothetical protein
LKVNVEQPRYVGLRGGLVNNHCDVQEAVIPRIYRSSIVTYLVTGLGIGAALSIFLTPKSGTETREWIANKCSTGVDMANEKGRKARLQVKDIVDQGQQQISEAVVAGRVAVGKPWMATS